MNLNKVVTVIAGIFEDSTFNYACFIAENLSSLLPNFAVKRITKEPSDWKDWLDKKCNENGWAHVDSPLIWREIELCGTKPTYIGGNSDFKKFINDYYGIDIMLSDTEQKNLDLDYLLADKQYLKNKSKNITSGALRITISGAGRSVCPDLVAQFATLKEISKNGLIVSLYDTPGHFFKIKDIEKDSIAIGDDLLSVQILDSLSDGLEFCDLLIILDHINREDQESTSSWLQRNYEATKEVAEQINIYAPSYMKIIFCSMGPTCFCANIIAKEVPKINKNQIVAVSAHYGLEMMYDFMKSLNVDIKGISCPPIWGFLGISQYVDIYHSIQKSSIYIPNKRALRSYKYSNLSLGVKYPELRWLLYLSFNKNPYEILAKRKSTCLYQVGRSEDFQKCKALCDLLKLWYQEDTDIGNDIITLGIASDGTFDLPEDLFFSQPVYLKVLNDNSRIWVPCSEFPLPSTEKDCILILKNCVETAHSILKSMNLL